jgi:hypothetical protein
MSARLTMTGFRLAATMGGLEAGVHSQTLLCPKSLPRSACTLRLEPFRACWMPLYLHRE